MKRFKRTPLFKFLIFCELLLVFSFLASFSILKAIQIFGEKPAASENGHPFPGRDHWTRNYRILNRFLRLPTPVTETGEKRPQEKAKTARFRNLQSVLSEADGRTLTADFVRLQMAEMVLEEKRFPDFNRLVSSVNSTAPFMEQQKSRLILKQLYARGKYSQLNDQYNRTPVRDKEIRLKLIDSLVRINQTGKALELFKNIFRHTRIATVEKNLPNTTVKQLLNKLEPAYWLEKWNEYARENDFTYFFQEKKFVRSGEMQALFYAEYYYARQRYRQARQYLSRVKSAGFQNQKDRLILKMNLRENRIPDEDIDDQLEKLRENGRLHADLLLNTANILFTREKTDLALKFYQQYLQQSGDHQNPDFWKAQWLTAWVKYRRNEKDQALEYFKRGGRSPVMPYRIANLYWASRLEKGSAPDIEKYPFTYYFTRINRQMPATNALKDFTALINENSSPVFGQMIDTLEFLLVRGLNDDGLRFVKLAKSESGISAGDANMLKLIESIIWLRQKKYYQAFISFRNNFNCYQCIYLPAYLSQIYLPVRYENEIRKHCRSNRLDPYLVLAIIREESFFKTDAVSRARAYGLMQILFHTAREVAARNGERLNRGALFQPDINIRLGVEYLKYLLEKYDGQLHLALAAYNAGDFRVDRWLERNGPAPADEFIEMIPFTETRVYVKNIIRNYFFYRYYHRKESL